MTEVTAADIARRFTPAGENMEREALRVAVIKFRDDAIAARDESDISADLDFEESKATFEHHGITEECPYAIDDVRNLLAKLLEDERSMSAVRKGQLLQARVSRDDWKAVALAGLERIKECEKIVSDRVDAGVDMIKAARDQSETLGAALGDVVSEAKLQIEHLRAAPNDEHIGCTFPLEHTCNAAAEKLAAFSKVRDAYLKEEVTYD